MASKKDVTTAQVGYLRLLANAKGASRFRFQQWLAKEAPAIMEGLRSILTFTTSVALKPIKRFDVVGSFKVDTSASAKVKIGWASDSFKRIAQGLVEESVPATSIAIHRLDKDALDKDIRAELGPKREKITFGQFYQVLARQGHGQDGNLLTNGYANIAYIKVAGVTWAVGAGWSAGDGGWFVFAYSVDRPYGWYAGVQVLSRK